MMTFGSRFYVLGEERPSWDGKLVFITAKNALGGTDDSGLCCSWLRTVRVPYGWISISVDVGMFGKGLDCRDA